MITMSWAHLFAVVSAATPNASSCPAGNVTPTELCYMTGLRELENQTCSSAICAARPNFQSGCNESLCSPSAPNRACEGLLCLAKSNDIQSSPCGAALCSTTSSLRAGGEQACTSALCTPESTDNQSCTATMCSARPTLDAGCNASL